MDAEELEAVDNFDGGVIYIKQVNEVFFSPEVNYELLCFVHIKGEIAVTRSGSSLHPYMPPHCY